MKIIAISSFKGGTAKTSTTLHIGSALARYYNSRVLLIDFDAQANLTAGLGLNPDDYDSLASVLQGTKDLSSVIRPIEGENLDLIPADTWLERIEVSGSLAADRYSHERLKNILADLNDHYEFILIDTPPSLCWLTESALIAAQYTLICATPEFYSIKGLERLSTFIESIGNRHPLTVLGVALSFWNQRGRNNEAFTDLIQRTFPNKLLKTKIRRDINVSETAIHGRPIFSTAPTSRAAQDYLTLTQELLTQL